VTAVARTRRVHRFVARAVEAEVMKIQLAVLGGLAAYFVWTSSLAGITSDLAGALGL
jgi:hypothetical protein